MDTNNTPQPSQTQQPQQYPLPEERGVDIKKYLFLILSHWWWFAISIFVALTTAYLINRYTQKVYSLSCSVIVGEPGSETGSIESILDELSRVRNRKVKATVENEISILKSYKLARLALNELDFEIDYVAVGRRGIAESHLYRKSPFYVEFDTSKSNLVNYPIYITILSEKQYLLEVNDDYNIKQKIDFGEKFEHANVNFTVYLEDSASKNIKDLSSKRFYFQLRDINSLANQYKNALNVEVNDEKGAILILSLNGYVPEKIANYLNKLSEVYLRSNLEEKNRTSENTIDFIDNQLGNIVDSLESTGMLLQQFRTEHKVVDLSREGTFLYEQMLELQSEQAILDIRNNYFNYLREYVGKRESTEDVIAPSIIGIQDNLLNELIAGLNQLIQQRRQLSFSVSSNSPQLALIDNQITNLKLTLAENLKSLSEANDLEINNLGKRIANIDKELEKLPSTEKQMIDIQRNFTINDEIYTFLLQKRAEAGITRASNTSDHKILDIARPENASLIRPKTSLNYLLGLGLGIGIPLLLLLLIEFFNTRIRDRNYLQANLKVPIIGNLGHNTGSTELPVAEKPKSSLSESFRGLRTNLQFILKEQKGGVIAITSAISGEGKTFCSVNLAAILAMGGKKTLLVNLDLRRPKIHRLFNLDNSSGMSTWLIGKNTTEEIIVESNIQNLSVVTSGPIPPNPSELIGSGKMMEFLEQVRKKFEYIVVDTPPVAIVTDTLVMKDLLDAMVFVVRHNFSNKQVVELANSLYEKHLIKNLGVAVNDIQLSGYYGYSYRYGYGYGYGYSYSYRAAYYDEESEKHVWLSRIKKWLKI